MKQRLETGKTAQGWLRLRPWTAVGLAGVFAAHLTFVAWQAGLGVSPVEHYREYVIIGQGLLEHGTYASPLRTPGLPPTPSSMFPPAYGMIVAAVYGLLGVESFAATLVLQLVNVCASTGVVVLVYLISRRVGGRSAARIAAVMAAVHPLVFVYAHLIWDTSLFMFAVALSVWWSLKLAARPVAAGPMFLYGVWLGLLALLNPALTPCYPLLVLWPVLPAARRGAGDMFAMPVSTSAPRTGQRRAMSLNRSIMIAACASLFGWAVAAGPWVVRNYVHFDRFIYVRGGLWHELWLGVCPEADDDRNAVFPTRFALQNSGVREHMSKVGETFFLDECRDRARQAIHEDPGRFLRLVGDRTADYWLGTLRSHTGPPPRWMPVFSARYMVTVFLILETAVLVLGVFAYRWWSARWWWMLAMFFLFSPVYCLTHVKLRYRSPAEPLAIVCAAVVLSRLLRRSGGNSVAPPF